jgi:hypothetical protein
MSGHIYNVPGQSAQNMPYAGARRMSTGCKEKADPRGCVRLAAYVAVHLLFQRLHFGLEYVNLMNAMLNESGEYRRADT